MLEELNILSIKCVGKSNVSDHLNTMGKIQNVDKWVPHELFEFAIQNCLIICTSLFYRHKKSSFCIKL